MKAGNILSLAMVVVALPCSAVAATGWWIAVQDDDAGVVEFLKDGQPEDLKHRITYIHQCETIGRGNADLTVATFDANYQTRVTHLDAGNTTVSCDELPEASDRTFVAVQQMLRGNARQTVGTSSLRDGESLPGFPTGTVAKVDESLRIAMPESVSIQEVVVRSESGARSVVFRDSPGGRAIAMPTAPLEYGGKYRWIARSGGKKYTDVFSVAGRDTTRELQQALSTAVQGVPDEDLRRIIQATWFQLYGFTFNAEAVLRDR